MSSQRMPPQSVIVYVDDEDKLQVYDSSYNSTDAAVVLANCRARYPEGSCQTLSAREAMRQQSKS